MKAVSPIEFIVSENGKLEKLFEFEKIAEKFKAKRKTFRIFTLAKWRGIISQNSRKIFQMNAIFSSKSVLPFSTKFYFPGI